MEVLKPTELPNEIVSYDSDGNYFDRASSELYNKVGELVILPPETALDIEWRKGGTYE